MVNRRPEPWPSKAVCKEWLLEQVRDEYCLRAENLGYDPPYNRMFLEEDTGSPVERRVVPQEQFEFIAQKLIINRCRVRYQNLLKRLLPDRYARQIRDEREFIEFLALLVLEEAHGQT